MQGLQTTLHHASATVNRQRSIMPQSQQQHAAPHLLCIFLDHPTWLVDVVGVVCDMLAMGTDRTPGRTGKQSVHDDDDLIASSDSLSLMRMCVCSQGAIEVI